MRIPKVKPTQYPDHEAKELQQYAMEMKSDLVSDDALQRYEAETQLSMFAFRNAIGLAPNYRFDAAGANAALRSAIIMAIDAALNPRSDTPTTDLAGFKRFEYGIVRIVSGKHVGKIGWYDDDHLGWSSVYFGTPYVTRRFGIRPAEIGLATQEQKAEYHMKHLPPGWRRIATESFDRNQRQDRTRAFYQPRQKSKRRPL